MPKTVKINALLSRREFKCTWIEGGEVCTATVSLADLLKADKNLGEQFEYIYALQDECDEILDMQVNDQKPFQFNRDNTQSKGVICRTR